MASHIARGGRRRRVLNEEARAAAGVQATISISGNAGAEAPRYGELACVEHHPQISDYVPRRKRAVLATIAGGGTFAAATLIASHAADSAATVAPGLTAAQIGNQLAGGIATWAAAVAMLAAAGLARLVYSLRRHRVDDVRGRYRVWKWISFGALAVSVNSVAGVHTLLTGAAVAATGWSLTTGGAEWWLAPTALVGAWIAVRLVLEIAESRSALALAIVAMAFYAVAAAGALGWSPAWLGAWSAAVTIAAPLMGHAVALAGMMWFARYVVLDVQGLIEHTPRPAGKATTIPAAGTSGAERHSEKSSSAAPATIPARRDTAPAPAARWNHDDDAAAEGDEDSDGQLLSKSERKRIRKQQQRRAA